MRTWRVLLLLALTGGVAEAADTAWVTVDKVVAVVNQDVVLDSEVQRRLSYAETTLQAVKDPAERAKRRIALRQQLVSSLVDERLFLQEALRLGVTAGDEDINRAIEQVKRDNQLDDAGLAAAVAKNGFTMPQYRDEIRRQILTAKVANAVLRARVRVTEDQIKALYEEARKRDPKAVAPYPDVRDRLQSQLVERGMMVEQQRWLAEQREVSYIDVRGLR